MMNARYLIASVFTLGLMALLPLAMPLALAQDSPTATAKPALHPIAADLASQLDKPEQPFVLIVNCTTKPGLADEFIEAMRAAGTQTVKEPGNLAYKTNQSRQEPNQFVLYEHWKSIAALDTHLKQPYLVKLLGQFDILLAEPPKLTLCLPVAQPVAESKK